MEDAIQLRLTRLIREFVSSHLPPLMGLLAEEGVERNLQKQRAERLVRGLLEFELAESLTDRGRRLPIAIESDETGTERVIFNAELLEDVEDEDILAILEEPATHFLELSAMKAGLVLQVRDDERLTSLYNRAARESAIEPIKVVEIPAVVEEKFRLLEKRSAELAIALTGQAFEPHGDLELNIDDFLERLDDEWPGWDELRSNPFIDSLIERVELIIREYDSVPDAETLVELCWESLELSSQSFIRHAARELRSFHKDVLDVTDILEDLADIVAEQEGGVPTEISEWEVFSGIDAIWERLFRTEQRILSWSTEGRPTPSISVFEPPIQTFHLNEPDSLPWEYPLLCWSMRERQALRDLLEGHAQTLDNHAPSAPNLDDELDRRGTNDTLALSDATDPPVMSVASFEVDAQEEGQFRLARATRSNYNKLLGSFRTLASTRQKDVLQRLHSSYDGYFKESEIVWERRFEAWEQLDPEEAFRVLTTELRHLVGPAAIFDPFEDPDGTEARRIPLFEFVVAWSEGGREATVRIPLVALESTFGDAPVRVRFVEVPSEDERPCRWLGDDDVFLRTLVDQPTEELLRSIHDDAVQLMFERA